MYVICPTCHNHYDDQHQSKNCMGIGRGVLVDPSDKGDDTRTAHRMTGTKPVTEHNADMRAVRAGEGNLPR